MNCIYIIFRRSDTESKTDMGKSLLHLSNDSEVFLRPSIFRRWTNQKQYSCQLSCINLNVLASLSYILFFASFKLFHNHVPQSFSVQEQVLPANICHLYGVHLFISNSFLVCKCCVFSFHSMIYMAKVDGGLALEHHICMAWPTYKIGLVVYKT